MIIKKLEQIGILSDEAAVVQSKLDVGFSILTAFWLYPLDACSGRGRVPATFAKIGLILVSLVLSLLQSPIVLAAPGDILGLSVSNGWMYVTLDGMGIGGVYRLGIDGAAGMNSPTNPSVVLRYKSPGFDTSGNPVQILRTNFATSPVRRTYPNMALNEEGGVGGRLILRLALMDHTYIKDSEVVASMAAGMYSMLGVGSQAVIGAPVQNASTQNYPKPVANWSRPPLDILNRTNAVLAITGFAHHADDGRPLQCAQFWAVDRLGMSSPIVTVSAAELDSSYGDALPITEYIGRLNIEGLAQGMATAHFRAYPRIGDASSVLDTSDGRYVFPSNEAAPTQFFADPTDAYGRTVAVVAIDGSNVSAVAVDFANFDPASPPAAFQTLAAAVTAIGRTNWLLHGRSDPGGGIVYMRTGFHAWTGGTVIITNQPQTWLTVTAFPGETPVFTGAVGSRNAGVRTKVTGVTFSSSTLATLDDMDFLWLGKGTVITNTTDPRFIDSVGNVWVNGATIASLPQGFQMASVSYNSQFRMLRGSRIDMAGQIIFPGIVIGNLRYGGGVGAVKIQCAVEKAPWAEAPSYPIIAFNAFYGEYAPKGGSLLELWIYNSRFRCTNGFAVVQNLFEQTSNATLASRCMSIASSEGSTPDTNAAPFAIIWHNTVVGQRANLLESAGGDVPSEWIDADRRLASVQNNLFEQANTKDERHYFPCDTGARIGSFEFQHGINCAGNIDLDPLGMDNGKWGWKFFGISSFPTTNSPNPSIFGWTQFVRRSAGTSDGLTAAEGLGDYHLLPTSPAAGLAYRKLLPFDMDGKPRSDRGASGVFEVQPPTVQVEATVSLTGEPGTGFEPGSFTFVRTGSLVNAMDVLVGLSGTAVEGLDFVPLGTSVRFEVGAAQAVWTVAPLSDTMVEGAESVIVTVRSGERYSVGEMGSATVWIRDGVGVVLPPADPVVTVSISDSRAGELGTGLGTGTFTLKRSGGFDQSLVVNVGSGGTATPGLDFAEIAPTALFQVGSATAEIVIAVLEDLLAEASETVVLNLLPGTGYVVGVPSSAPIRVEDDDTIVSVTASDSLAGEPGSGKGTGRFTFTRVGSLVDPLLIHVVYSGTATAGVDYIALPPEILFAAGVSTVNQTFTVLDDSLAEGNETASVTVIDGIGYRAGVNASAMITVLDDDTEIRVAATDAIAGEPGSGQGTARFTFTRLGNTVIPLLVNFTVSGTSTAGIDYTSIGNSVLFNPGSSTATQIVAVLDDDAVEGDETVILSLEPGAGYSVAMPFQATIVVKDDDQVVNLRGTDAIAGEPGTGQGTGRFTFSRLGSTAAALTVSFVVSGTAIQGVDYTSIGMTATFSAGAAAVSTSLSVINDVWVEGDEEVVVTLLSGSGYTLGEPSTARIVIQDDDAPVTVTPTSLRSISPLPAAIERPSDSMMFERSPDGKLYLMVRGEPGETWVLQQSDDLLGWSRMGEISGSADVRVNVEDPGTGKIAVRYFRLVR